MTMFFQSFVLTQALGLAALNAAMNGAYTWFLWRAEPQQALFGEGGIAFDLASTPVWIAALSTLFGVASIRKQLREGRVALPDRSLQMLAPRLPRNIPARAGVMAVLGALAFSLPIAMMLQSSGEDVISSEWAVGLKVALTVPLTLVIVPVVILTAVADVARRPAFKPA
jgi:hypothetical protein